MQTLWLFRCCETAWDQAERLRGATDLPAAESSVVAMREMVARLSDGPEYLFHPPDEAGAESAQVISSRFACNTRSMEALADPDMGLLEGLSAQEFERRFESRFAEWTASPLTVQPPEGEPLALARARILDAVADALASHPRARIGLVLHPIALAMVRDALARGDGSRLWERIQGKAACARYALPHGASALLGD